MQERDAAKKRPSERCAVCGYVNNIRADGTFGKHHVWIGREYQGECGGTGLTPAEARVKFERLYGGFDE